jgi:hypothetical protein
MENYEVCSILKALHERVERLETEFGAENQNKLLLSEKTPIFTHPIINKLLGIMQEDSVFQQHWKIDRQTTYSINLSGSGLFPVEIEYNARMNVLVAKYFIKPDNPTIRLFNIIPIRSVLNSLNDLHNHQKPN